MSQKQARGSAMGAPENLPLDDRRGVLRYKANSSGRLLFVDNPCFAECTIRDISEDGARLSLIEAVRLPPLVLLWVPHTGAIHECDVRWRRGRLVGVRFTDVGARRARSVQIARGFGPLLRVLCGRTRLH